MDFNKNEFDTFSKDVKDALEEVCKKYDLKLKSNWISYSEVDFDMKLTFQKNMDKADIERIRFESDCEYYGFLPEDYLRTFEYYGRLYEFYAFMPRAKKYKCVVRDVETGEKMKVTDYYLLEKFGRSNDYFY